MAIKIEWLHLGIIFTFSTNSFAYFNSQHPNPFPLLATVNYFSRHYQDLQEICLSSITCVVVEML